MFQGKCRLYDRRCSHLRQPLAEGITRERLQQEGHVRLNFSATHEFSVPEAGTPQLPFLPFAHGNFRTPSGKAELYSEAMKALGLHPVAHFVPPAESRYGKNKDKDSFPLEFLARKADNFMNSTFPNQPSIREMEDVDLLEMHPQDAQARNITNGQKVRVFNRRGEIYLTARVDGAVCPGVVASTLNWAKLSPGMRNVNVLTSEKLSDLGNSATFYSVLVEVESTNSVP